MRLLGCNITITSDHIPALPGSDWGKAEKGGGGPGAASRPKLSPAE